MKKSNKKIKEKIEDFEMKMNGYYRLCGRSVKVVNLRIRKDRYIADIILINDEDRIRERIDDCYYPKDLFENDRK